jgi:hypothetical protein
MRETRNPFKLRRSENIDTDTTFLSLFEPGILEVIAEEGLPETVQLIRSAAGGGKTSLLRLFTPSVLRRLYSRRVEDQDLFSRLQTLGVIDDRGPRLLGVSLLCGRNYAGLEDLRLDAAVRTRLFLGLLNGRIVLAVLRSALALRGLEYPRDINRVRVTVADRAEHLPAGLDFPCSGDRLYDWARAVEKTICSALDSFGPLEARSLPGSDTLFALLFLPATAAHAVCDATNLIPVRVVELCANWPTGSSSCKDFKNYTRTEVQRVLRETSDDLLPICLNHAGATFSIKRWKWSSDKPFTYGSGKQLFSGKQMKETTDLGKLLYQAEFLPRSWGRLDIVIVPWGRLGTDFGGDNVTCRGEPPEGFGDSPNHCIEGNALIIRAGDLTPHILAHEIGHWLGLAHPFVGCKTESLPDTVNDKESEGKRRATRTCKDNRDWIDYRIVTFDQDACGKPIDDQLKQQLDNLMEYGSGCGPRTVHT